MNLIINTSIMYQHSKFLTLPFSAYCLCLETSSIQHYTGFLASLHHRSVFDKLNIMFQNTNNALIPFPTEKGEIFPFQVLSSPFKSGIEWRQSKRKEKCCEKRREGWINLIRCALLSNFSYRHTVAKTEVVTLCMSYKFLTTPHIPHTHLCENWQIGFISSSMSSILYNR